MPTSSLEDVFVFLVVHGVIVHIYFVDVIDSSVVTSPVLGRATHGSRYLFDSRVDGCSIAFGTRGVRYQIMEQSLAFPSQMMAATVPDEMHPSETTGRHKFLQRVLRKR